ncbi:MAG: LysM peptidoglycan-binding domain-containing protein [Clostridiales bacterium]|nr:LysM peptidoglycan-binding domain-containing protein [Clostridiales bacterium]
MTPLKSARYARQMRHRFISLLLVVVILLCVTVTASGDRPDGDGMGGADILLAAEQEAVSGAELDAAIDPVISEKAETAEPPEASPEPVPAEPAAPVISEEPAAEEPEAPAAEEDTYTVKAGDCLWKIAEKAYGNGADWTKIYEANSNQINNPNLIYPGQVFVIPAI